MFHIRIMLCSARGSAGIINVSRMGDHAPHKMIKKMTRHPTVVGGQDDN